jgi:NADH dehydrogenase
VWTLQAKLLSILPNPPLTEDQVILMRDDNVVAEGVLTFDDLGVPVADLELLLPLCLDESLAAHTRP